MADIILNIQGQATAASSAVDTLVGKLEQLSSTLERIAKLSKSAFSNMGANIDTGKFDTLSERLDDIVDKMNQMSGKSGNASVEIKETTKQVSSLGTAAGKSGGFFDKFGKSIGRIAFYRLLRTAIKAVGQAFKEGLQNAYAFSKLHGGPLANAMDKITKSSTIMKNQLGAAFGGLITAIAPVITFLTNLLTRFATFLTQIFALLGGQNTYKVATDGFSDIEQAAGGAGGAVKGLLAPWDELNVIGQESGGGGGASALDAAAGMFEYAEVPEWLSNLWESSGIGENIERLKQSWQEFVGLVENGDFSQFVNLLILDPLRAVIDTLDGIIMLLKGIMSGDLWVVDNAVGKLVFDSLMNSVVLPFTRTIDMLFGTNLTEKVLGFKENVDNGFATVIKPEIREKIRKRITQAFQKAWNDIKKIWNSVSTWFNNNVVKPVVKFFRDAWKKISGFFSDAWNGIKKVWTKVATWFDTNVIKPIKKFFSPIVEWFGTLFRAAWQIVRGIWVIVSGWFKTNVIDPLKTAWNKFKDALIDAFKVAWTNIKNTWNTVVSWFKTNIIEPLKTAWNQFKNVIVNVFSDAWQTIKTAALKFALWILDNIAEPIAVSFATAFDAIYSAYLTIKNAITKTLAKVYNWIATNVINPIIDKINVVGRVCAKVLGEEYTDVQKLGTVSEESFTTMGDESESAAARVKGSFKGMRDKITKELSVQPTVKFKYTNDKAQIKLTAKLENGRVVGLSGVKVIPFAQDEMYAEGGFPTTGQLFVANEAGPEMVGRIGNRTAVANNDQIVSSVASGVAEANATGNALLSQLVSVGRQLLNKDLTITPSIALGQVVQRSQSMYARS